MSQNFSAWSLLRKVAWQDVLLSFGVFILARLISFIIRRLILLWAKKASPHLRLSILRSLPIVRLLVGIGAATVIVQILIEPTFQNIVMLVASVGLSLAFTLKDYGLSVVGG